jgi:hypothetical protein
VQVVGSGVADAGMDFVDAGLGLPPYMDAPFCQTFFALQDHRRRLQPYIRPRFAARGRGP